jgi:NAD(P)-dependent dehydrogenase (short-subunit alcohol dehydrogenase family)
MRDIVFTGCSPLGHWPQPERTVPLDLTSLASVHAAATTIQDIAPEIHVLMNNPGVMFTPLGRTADGFEIQFGTNHLARHMSRADFTKLSQFAPKEPDANKQAIDVRRDFTLPEHGAATQVWAAVSPDLADVGSVYLSDCRIRDDVAPYALDEDHALRLWELSESLCALGSRP